MTLDFNEGVKVLTDKVDGLLPNSIGISTGDEILDAIKIVVDGADNADLIRTLVSQLIGLEVIARFNEANDIGKQS